jgi:ABC-type bacteriocin/lantibiotic exporter with double-glycine peptidase domain
MLLTSLGRPATEAELEREMSPGPDGVTLTSIVKTGGTRGVRLEAWRVRPDELGSLRTPAIFWIDGDHFVVFDSLAAEGAYLRDPSAGRLVVSLEGLLKRWDGTAALLAGPP